MEIVIAIIGLIATVLGTGATFYGVLASKKKEKKQEQRISDGAKALQGEIQKRIGYSGDKIFIRFHITDEEGAVEETRRYTGIKAAPGVHLASIPGYVWVSTPGGKISEYPVLTDFGDAKLRARIEYLSRNQKRCDLSVVFDEPLKPDDTPFDYEFKVKYSKCVLMHRKNVKAAYGNDAFKNDYCSYESVTPIEELVIEVVFPPGLEFVPAPNVFFGGEGWVHNQELNRVSDGFTVIPNGARLRVKKPLLGFTYIIYWITPE